MKKSISNFIDCLIRTKASRDKDGYHLCVDHLDNDCYSDIVIKLLNDNEDTRTIIENHIQELIDERIDIAFAQDQYDAGKRPFIDQINGEVSWR